MEKNQTAKGLRKNSTLIAFGGMLLVMLILVLGTIWMGQAAKKSSEASVETVSHLYLDELAGRREQVVADNLKGRIQDMDVALEMIEPGDLRDEEHLQEYQAKMKKFFHLEKFAFVDEDGVIHTSMGLRYDIDQFQFPNDQRSGDLDQKPETKGQDRHHRPAGRSETRRQETGRMF